MAGNGEARKSQKPEKETREEAASLAKAFDDWSDQGAGNQRGANAHQGKRVAYITVTPAVAIFGVQRPHGGKRIMRQIIQRDDNGESR